MASCPTTLLQGQNQSIVRSPLSEPRCDGPPSEPSHGDVDLSVPQVLLEMYSKYRELWLVELLYDDLLHWNDWFVTSRSAGPLGIISLGSDRIDGYHDSSANQMQGARYESGLDNSPMYDGDFFNASMGSSGSIRVGQMVMYDVGMASMFVQVGSELSISSLPSHCTAHIAGGRQSSSTRQAAQQVFASH